MFLSDDSYGFFSLFSFSVTPSKEKFYHLSSTCHIVPSPYTRPHTKNTPSSHLLTLHCFDRLLGNPPHPKYHSDMFKALTTSFPHNLCTPSPCHAFSVTTPHRLCFLVSTDRSRLSMATSALAIRRALRPPRTSDMYWAATMGQAGKTHPGGPADKHAHCQAARASPRTLPPANSGRALPPA